MASEKDTKVSYIKGYETVGELTLPVWAYTSFSNSGVKRYHEAIYHLCEVTGFARDLMDWLTGVMNTDNIVHNDKHTKERLLKFYRELKQKPPSISMINHSFRKLVDKKLLVERCRGTYMVNPKFFINAANEESRARLLRIILEFEDGKDTKISVR